MAPASIRVALALVLVLGGAACGPGRAIVAPPDDYAAYRSTRALPTLEERLRAAELYLAAYPEGMFAADVRRAYARGEEALWASKRGSVAGLQAYLEELPAGPHAPEARRELDARLAASVDLLGRGARRTEQRLAGAAATRAAARDELAVWLRRLADGRVFEGTLAEAPAALVVPWSLGSPAAVCPAWDGERRHCEKSIVRTYSIARPASGGPERDMLLDVSLSEDDQGRLCAAGLGGPRLFSKYEEASSGTDAHEEPGRTRAILAVQSLVRSTLDTRVGAASPCTETPAPEHQRGVTLSCGELVVKVVHGLTDDWIWISRASSCSGP